MGRGGKEGVRYERDGLRPDLIAIYSFLVESSSATLREASGIERMPLLSARQKLNVRNVGGWGLVEHGNSRAQKRPMSLRECTVR